LFHRSQRLIIEVATQIMNSLKKYLQEWDKWAKDDSVAFEFDGWEEAFPGWEPLIKEAEELALKEHLDYKEISLLEKVLLLSEESEEMLDFIKENIDRVSEGLMKRLSESDEWKVRWQIYDAVKLRQEKFKELIEKGKQDKNDYCRRRLGTF
jgi:hypothetical protein